MAAALAPAVAGFCPACGEPSLEHVHSDVFSCRSCERAGEVRGFDNA